MVWRDGPAVWVIYSVLARKEDVEGNVLCTYKRELVAPVFILSEFDLPNAIISVVGGFAVVRWIQMLLLDL